MEVRTSLSHPLQIDPLPVGSRGGVLGITFCPGKKAPSINGFVWDRDLDVDLDAVRAWGAQAVLTLIEPHEFRAFEVAGLGAGVAARGLEWHHLPITDMHAPDARFESGWATTGGRLRERLLGGGSAVVHCRGGLGRAGTVAARILVDTGTPPPEAVRRVRLARKGTIENDEQLQYVLALRPAGQG